MACSFLFPRFELVCLERWVDGMDMAVRLFVGMRVSAFYLSFLFPMNTTDISKDCGIRHQRPSTKRRQHTQQPEPDGPPGLRS